MTLCNWTLRPGFVPRLQLAHACVHMCTNAVHLSYSASLKLLYGASLKLLMLCAFRTHSLRMYSTDSSAAQR